MSVRRWLVALLVVAAPIVGQEARGEEQPVASAQLTAAQLALADYAYRVFPQQLAAVERAAALAEHEAALWQQRVTYYEPMRSFGVYGATYTADQAAQLQAFAARQRAECARQQVVHLWRERQAIVADLTLRAAH